MRKSKKVKKIKRKTKKQKGGISENNFLTLHKISVEIARKTVSLSEMINELEKMNIALDEHNKQHPEKLYEPIVLSVSDWGELIAKSFKDDIFFVFDDTPLGNVLNGVFNYEKPESFSGFRGNTDEFPLSTIYPTIIEISRLSVSFTDMVEHLDAINRRLDELNKEHPDEPIINPITLSMRDWCEFIAECYKDGIYFIFDESELGEQLNIVFDYKTSTDFSYFQNKISVDRPRSLSVSQSYQGRENSCFAHSAALMIFHNIYKLPLTKEEEDIYERNNCNLHLNTTKVLEEYDALQTKCGEKGATRILLFLYIYNVIKKKYGCNFGDAALSIIYYLTIPFQPDIFPTLNSILGPIVESINRDDFAVSSMDMIDFVAMDYKDYLHEYFQSYYATISIDKPLHQVIISDINDRGIIGKDSGDGNLFYIPHDQFHPKGVFTSYSVTLRGISTIVFLYEKSKTFSTIFSRLLKATTCHYINGKGYFKKLNMTESKA